MLHLLFVTALLFSSSSFGKCRIYVPIKAFDHQGYTVYFDFTELLKRKNYTEVLNAEEADDAIVVDGIEAEGPRFHKAKSIIEMVDIKIEDSVICLTQLCTIRDFAKAFNKSYKKLSDQLPNCQ